jgi:DNA-binding GntR family transcriptional regulator
MTAQQDDLRILAGILRAVRVAAERGTPLPGEFELAQRLGCARRQVRDILAPLEQQGIVLRRQGAATLVDPVAMRMSVRFEDQIEHEILLQQLGYDTTVEVVDSADIGIPAPLASTLRVAADAPAARVVKRWRADGVVAMLAFNTVPLPPGYTAGEVGASVYTAMRKLWGEPVAWEVTTPSAEILSEADAKLFEHEPGSAVLTLDVVGIGLSGQRLFHARELHDPRTVSYSLMRSVRPPQVFSTARYRI